MQCRGTLKPDSLAGLSDSNDVDLRLGSMLRLMQSCGRANERQRWAGLDIAPLGAAIPHPRLVAWGSQE
jgi:hypothetical protein